MTIAPMLELRDVEASYGPFRALFGVSLTVGRGEAVALLGANGVGKTTVARVASGLLAPTSGTVEVEGIDVTGRPTRDFARMGVAHAPEGRSVFGTLTVQENLTLSFRPRSGAVGWTPGSTGPTSSSPSWGTGATSSPGPSRVASSACCRWPG